MKSTHETLGRHRARPFGRKGLLSALLISSAMTTVAVAQEAQDTQDEELTTVLNEIVVTTPGGYAQDIRTAPASISVIGEDQLKRRAVADLSEAIRTTPGVNVGFGSDGTRGISMRGLGSGYTLILIDGKRVNAGATTIRHYNGDLDWVPLEAIERIEVVRGPMSTLYGSDALGGVVNIITKKGSQTWTGSATTEFLVPEDDATGMTRRLNGYVSGPIIQDLLSFTAYGNWSRKDPDDGSVAGGVQVPDGSDDFSLNGRLTYTPTADHTFELEVGHGRERYKPYLAPGEVDGSETEISRTTASLSHEGEWDLGRSNSMVYFEQATNSNGVTGVDIDSYNVAVDNKFAFTPFEYFWMHNVIVGSEFRYEKLSDPANLGKDNSVTGTSGEPEADVFTVALFAEDQIEFNDRFRMTAGLRYDYHEMFGSHLSPRTYFMYDLTDTLTFKAGWAQAFKAPNLRQLDPNWVTTSRGRGCGAVGGPCEMVGNPDLQPETSNSYEAGFQYDDGAWQGGVAYFYNDIKDKITSARTASLIIPGAGVGGADLKYVQQINVDRARSQGIEANLTIPVHPDLTWTNSLTYLLESQNLETGMPLSAEPEYALHTELTWQAMENWSLTASVDWYGKQVDYVQVTETLTAQNVRPYSTVGFSTKYDFNENLTLKAGINNIFDSQPESESNYKENGRTYFLAVTGKF